MHTPVFSVKVHDRCRPDQSLPFKWGLELPPTVPTEGTLSFEPYVDPGGIKRFPIPFPLNDQHHTALGKFLDAWSGLEITINTLLGELFGTDEGKTRIVSGALGTRASVDVITSLTAVQLTTGLAKAGEGLAERLQSLNTKRNRLVHGCWRLEAIVDIVGGSPRIRSRIFRVSLPSDPRIDEKLDDLKNQKDRTKYMFSPKQLAGATRDVVSLRNDFGEFLQRAFPQLGRGR